MTYRDLNIHQRINAKGNKVTLSPLVERIKGNLLKRICSSRVGMEAYWPSFPFQAFIVLNHRVPA